MTTVDEALRDVEAWTDETRLSGPAGIRARVLAAEVRRLRAEKLEYDMGDYSNTLIGKQWRETSADNERLMAEVQRLQHLLPFFARLPSFAAWVEDAKATAEELKLLKDTLSDQAAALRGVLDENVSLRARSEQTPSFSAVAVDALLKTIDEIQGFDFDDTKLDAAAEAVRESREPPR